MNKTILVVGATGNLGGRIVDELLEQGANVRALVRAESSREKVGLLREKGVEIRHANMFNVSEVVEACTGVDCVVSAVSGLREVIIDAQKALLDGSGSGGCPLVLFRAIFRWILPNSFPAKTAILICGASFINLG